MGSTHNVTTRPYTGRRKYRRFNVRYPVHGTFSSGNTVSEFDALSTNISIGGLLMKTASEILPHSLVSFALTIEVGMVRPIHLVGEGEVVRLEPALADACFAVAVACKRGIVQIHG